MEKENDILNFIYTIILLCIVIAIIKFAWHIHWLLGLFVLVLFLSV